MTNQTCLVATPMTRYIIAGDARRGDSMHCIAGGILILISVAMAFAGLAWHNIAILATAFAIACTGVLYCACLPFLECHRDLLKRTLSPETVLQRGLLASWSPSVLCGCILISGVGLSLLEAATGRGWSWTWDASVTVGVVLLQMFAVCFSLIMYRALRRRVGRICQCYGLCGRCGYPKHSDSLFCSECGHQC